jgi:hypothetical protein
VSVEERCIGARTGQQIPVPLITRSISITAASGGSTEGTVAHPLLQVMEKNGGEWQAASYHNTDIKPNIPAPELHYYSVKIF